MFGLSPAAWSELIGVSSTTTPTTNREMMFLSFGFMVLFNQCREARGVTDTLREVYPRQVGINIGLWARSQSRKSLWHQARGLDPTSACSRGCRNGIKLRSVTPGRKTQNPGF